jgi:hypothetical protein
MTGYESSPDFGGPEPSWREAAVILAVIGTIAGAVRALRQLLLWWGSCLVRRTPHDPEPLNDRKGWLRGQVPQNVWRTI